MFNFLNQKLAFKKAFIMWSIAVQSQFISFWVQLF